MGGGPQGRVTQPGNHLPFDRKFLFYPERKVVHCLRSGIRHATLANLDHVAAVGWEPVPLSPHAVSGAAHDGDADSGDQAVEGRGEEDVRQSEQGHAHAAGEPARRRVRLAQALGTGHAVHVLAWVTGLPVLLLATKGARRGELRTARVLGVPDGDGDRVIPAIRLDVR